MSGEIQIGVGDLWTRQLEPTAGLVAVISAQKRLPGQIETFLLIAEAEAHNGALAAPVIEAFARNEAVNAIGYEPAFELEGQWARAPRTLKQGARAVWYRQLYSHHPRTLTVTLRHVLPTEEIPLPDDLPMESSIAAGATSGVLRAGSACLLRVSTAAREADHRSAFSPIAVQEEARRLSMLYTNGPLGWMDTIMCFDGSSEVLTVGVRDR